MFGIAFLIVIVMHPAGVLRGIDTRRRSRPYGSFF